MKTDFIDRFCADVCSASQIQPKLFLSTWGVNHGKAGFKWFQNMHNCAGNHRKDHTRHHHDHHQRAVGRLVASPGYPPALVCHGLYGSYGGDHSTLLVGKGFKKWFHYVFCLDSCMRLMIFNVVSGSRGRCRKAQSMGRGLLKGLLSLHHLRNDKEARSLRGLEFLRGQSKFHAMLREIPFSSRQVFNRVGASQWLSFKPINWENCLWESLRRMRQVRSMVVPTVLDTIGRTEFRSP